MQLVLDEPSAAPGDTVTGHVRLVDATETETVRDITIELVQEDKSSRCRNRGSEVVARTHIEPAGFEPAHFSIELPRSAVPGFTSRHGNVSWLVQATGDIFGPDVKESQILKVREPSEPVVVESQVIPVQLSSRAKAPRPPGQIINSLMLLGLTGFGIYMFGLTLHQYFTDEYAGNGVLGFAALMVPFTAVMVWMLLQRHPLRIGGVSVEPNAVVFSRGQIVTASVTVDRPGLAIGLEGVERYAEDRRSKHGRNVVYPEHIFFDTWQPLEKGTSEVEFEIPADALVSYSGDSIFIVWRLSVISEKKRGKSNRTSGHLTPLLVLH